MLRANILVTQEAFFGPAERAMYFPAYYHVLARQGAAQLQGLGGVSGEWNGVLNALKTKMSDDNQVLKSNVGALKAKVDGMELDLGMLKAKMDTQAEMLQSVLDIVRRQT